MERIETAPSGRPSNEYVLNFAFLSFLVFTSIQFFFASLAKSDAMMTDCAAMMVDVVTYLFNFLAERLKHFHGSHEVSARDLRLRRLYLELIPPLLSVVTLIAVTIAALQKAVAVLFWDDVTTALTPPPDVYIMFIFSALNLLLDALNVSCFARVDQAVGLPGQVTHHHDPHGHANLHNEAPLGYGSEAQRNDAAASEATPLVSFQSALSNAGLSESAIKGVDESYETTSEDSTDATGTLNLNMCSAWTHVCADTLRSVAVLIASAVAFALPDVLSARQADSGGAVVVSVIILASLVPLIQALYLTACKIRDIWFGVAAGHDHSHDLAKFYVT